MTTPYWWFGQGGAQPFQPAPRYYTGVNMCGSRVQGLPLLPGCSDPTLVMSWLIPSYSASDRQTKIYPVWKAQGGIDVLLDWDYARVACGWSVDQFLGLCAELVAQGFRPCPWLCSPDFQPQQDVEATWGTIQQLLPALIASGLVPRVIVGNQLGMNNWLTPAQVQTLIDRVAPPCVTAGIKVYVHFAPRYMSWQQSGDNATFWNLNVGKLTGVYAQTDGNADMPTTRDWVNDCLERCAGGDNMPVVIIDGHGVDFIAGEITASRQFGPPFMSEADGNAFGAAILASPPRTGPAGTARVMGSGNGY